MCLGGGAPSPVVTKFEGQQGPGVIIVTVYLICDKILGAVCRVCTAGRL